MSTAATGVLQGSDIFRGLPDRVRSEIADAALTKQFYPGTKLFEEGAHPDSVHVILKGKVKLTAGEDGFSIILKLALAGEALGGASVLSRMPSSFTAAGTGRGESLFWPARRFERFARDFPQIAANCIRSAVVDEWRMVRRLCAARTDNVERRIARSLVDLMTGDASSPAGILRVGGREIAELSDTTLYTVSRVLSRLKRDGILGGGRGYIAILDPERLSQILED